MLVKINGIVTFKNSTPSTLNVPSDIKKIDNYWKKFIKNKTDYWNGEIFIDINLKDKNQVISYSLKYLKVPINNENYFPIRLLYVGYLNFTSTDFANYMNNNVFDGEIKECLFYSAEECLDLKLTDNDISYLKEFVEPETKK